MKERNYAIDFWRIVFSYIVACLHSNLFWNNACFPGGAVGVEFFFIVTGYLLNQSVESGKYTTWEYVIRKYKTILPTLLLVSIIFFLERVYFGYDIYTLAIGFFSDCTFLKMVGITSGTIGLNSVAWYLSSMLIALLVLHPIMRWNREVCAKYVFPVIEIVLIGIMIQNYGSVVIAESPIEAFMRAIVEIALGVSLYEVTKKLRTMNFTRIGTAILSVVELFGYTITIYYAMGHLMDISAIVLLLLGVAIAITFSGKTPLTKLLNRLVKTNYIGEFSLSLYLSHFVIVEYISNNSYIVYYYKYETLMFMYLAAATIFAIFINVAVRYISKWSAKIKLFKN